MRISTLKKRAEFQRVRGGGRWSADAFVLEGKPRLDDRIEGPRFGFTVTKKLGGAVVRNRIRRRFRAAIGELVNALADPRFDYVVVARQPSFDLPYVKLRDDLTLAFKRVHQGPRQTSRKPGSGDSRSAGDAKSPSVRRTRID